MIDPVRRVYIVTKHRALSGKDASIRSLPDIELLLLDMIWNSAGEIVDFPTWAGLALAVVPEFFNRKPISQSVAQSEVQTKATENFGTRSAIGKTVSVQNNGNLIKMAKTLAGSMVGVAERKASPAEIANFNATVNGNPV